MPSDISTIEKSDMATPVPTFGFQPTGDLVTVLTAGHSRSAEHAVLCEMHPSAASLSRELDALFARGASEEEIAEFRLREAEILANDRD